MIIILCDIVHKRYITVHGGYGMHEECGESCTESPKVLYESRAVAVVSPTGWHIEKHLFQ